MFIIYYMSIDISLPNHKVILEFIQLQDKEKLKCIELGLLFLSYGQNKIQYWNNDQWENKIQILEKRIQREKERNTELIELHKNEKELFAHEIRSSEKIKLQHELEKYSEKNLSLNSMLEKKNYEFNNLYKQLTDEFDKKNLQQRDFYEQKLSILEKKNEVLQNNYESCLRQSQNSTILGQVGEEFTYQELNKRFPKAEIQDCRKQKGKGDFIMIEKDFSMLIEIKNYTKNVPKPEIDKFYRDFDNNQDYQCAILVSLHSGICSRGDFHLEVRDKRPILFLHQLNKNIAHISLAVRFFKLLLKTENIDLSNKEIVGKLHLLQPIIKRNWNNMRKKIQQFEKDLFFLIDEQESSIRDIFSLLS